ncbi:MAG: hypothetical protein ACYTHM_14080 [Planctomycetota bacterium]|jgi:hypothetical protein
MDQENVPRSQDIIRRGGNRGGKRHGKGFPGKEVGPKGGKIRVDLLQRKERGFLFLFGGSFRLLPLSDLSLLLFLHPLPLRLPLLFPILFKARLPALLFRFRPLLRRPFHTAQQSRFQSFRKPLEKDPFRGREDPFPVFSGQRTEDLVLKSFGQSQECDGFLGRKGHLSQEPLDLLPVQGFLGSRLLGDPHALKTEKQGEDAGGARAYTHLVSPH